MALTWQDKLVGVACIVSVVGLSRYDFNVTVSAQIVGSHLWTYLQVWFHCQLCRAWFSSQGRAFKNGVYHLLET